MAKIKNIMKGKRAGMEMTLDDMADRIGMHKSQISDYESRRGIPTLTRAVRLMEAYDMTFEEICEHFRIELNKEE